jgi:uncharacterized protein YutE (UPF0331/DUF86 family)
VTDRELVLRKIALVREHLARVARRRPGELSVLRADVDLQDALVLSLLVALQESIDIAFHIAADEGWGIPASNAEAFEILSRQGLFAHDVAIALGATARLRNRIVHGYASVDLERVWEELPAGLALLETFTVAVVTWLDQTGS